MSRDSVWLALSFGAAIGGCGGSHYPHSCSAGRIIEGYPPGGLRCELVQSDFYVEDDPSERSHGHDERDGTWEGAVRLLCKAMHAKRGDLAVVHREHVPGDYVADDSAQEEHRYSYGLTASIYRCTK